MSLLLWITGAALLIAGLVMIIHGTAGRSTTSRGSSEQGITFSAWRGA